MVEIQLRGELWDNDSTDILRWWGWRDITAPMDIQAALEAAGGDEVTLLVNSPGGDMAVGNEIRSMLRRYQGKTTALIQGMGASAATLAAAGCGTIQAEPGALLCYHNPQGGAQGDRTPQLDQRDHGNDEEGGLFTGHGQEVKNLLNQLFHRSSGDRIRRAAGHMGILYPNPTKKTTEKTKGSQKGQKSGRSFSVRCSSRAAFFQSISSRSPGVRESLSNRASSEGALFQGQSVANRMWSTPFSRISRS